MLVSVETGTQGWTETWRVYRCSLGDSRDRLLTNIRLEPLPLASQLCVGEVSTLGLFVSILVCGVPCWWHHSACHLFTPGRCCVIPDSFPLLGERKNMRYYTTRTHTFNKAYLASMVCHGQHDVLVSNGCCIRLGNKTEQTRAVSDAMRASNFRSFFSFLFFTVTDAEIRMGG